MRRSERIALAVLGLSVMAVPRASAQEGTITGVVVEVKDQGGGGQQGITGTLFTDGGTTSLGPTGSDGTFTVPYPGTIPSGTGMEVVRVGTSPLPKLYFFPSGQTPQECKDAESTPSDDDDCHKLGAFIWGVTDRIDLTASAGMWTFRSSSTGQPATGFTGGRPGLGHFSAGLYLDASYYWNFEDVVGSQPGIADYTSKQLTWGVGASLEWTPLDHLTLGLGVHYNPHTFEQAFDSPDPLAPVSVSGSVDSWMVDASVAPRLRIGPVNLGFPFGMTWAEDNAKYVESLKNSQELGFSRKLNTWKARTGVLFDVPMSSRFAARAGIDLTSSYKHTDADANVRVRFGMLYSF